MTAPSSRPSAAQDHADTVREVVRRLSGTGDVPAIDFALDALLKEVERLTAERDAATTTLYERGDDFAHDVWKERAVVAERERDEAQKWYALHVSELEHRYLRERGRAEAAERERDNAKDALERMRQELVRVDGLNRAAEALAAARGALRWFFSQNLGLSSEAMFREALGIPASITARPWDKYDSEGVEETYANAPSWLRPLMRPRLEWYREIARLGWPADPPPRAALADGGQDAADDGAAT